MRFSGNYAPAGLSDQADHSDLCADASSVQEHLLDTLDRADHNEIAVCSTHQLLCSTGFLQPLNHAVEYIGLRLLHKVVSYIARQCV